MGFMDHMPVDNISGGKRKPDSDGGSQAKGSKSDGGGGGGGGSGGGDDHRRQRVDKDEDKDGWTDRQTMTDH